jgi:uncharacterized protein YjhX (UPF0386 family)
MPTTSTSKTVAVAAKKAPARAKAPARRRAASKSSRPAGDKRVTIADIAPAKKALPPKAPAAGVKSEKKAVESVEEAPKVVRDGFTMPQVDYAKFKSLKALCLKSGIAVKKSELLRAGLQVLESLPPKDLLARIAALPPIKAGRKKKKD